MSNINAGLRQLVISRASNRCEYCGLAQDGQEASFHIDHIWPVVEGGSTEADNLALACVSCSLRKGARTHAIDPISSAQVPLFKPRLDNWAEHFAWDGLVVVGLTITGRATLTALQLNRPLILAIRAEEMLRGRHPPPADLT